MKRLCYNSVSTLKDVLKEILEVDTTDLDLRFQLIIQAMTLANQIDYKTGLGTDNKNPGVVVAYIELPTGQVSWHMPNDNNLWDGHSTEEKNERVKKFIEGD